MRLAWRGDLRFWIEESMQEKMWMAGAPGDRALGWAEEAGRSWRGFFQDFSD